MKVYFQTHGCSTNFSESEIMKGLLVKAGFSISLIDDSDVIVINICTVKGEFNALKEIKGIKDKFPDKKLVVAGCLTPKIITDVRSIDESCGLINTHNIDKIVEVVENTANGDPIEAISNSKLKKINMPKVRKNKIVSIVPILSGCNHSCAYCSVKDVKGSLVSYPAEDIISEVKQSVMQGCKEVWITSQDNAAYMMEGGKSKLVELLKQVVAVEGDFKIRLGMMNPDNVIAIIDELLEVYANDKMFKFIHIPVQSGNDEVLSKMNRTYSVNDFKELIRKIKTAIPQMTLATDVIVGFPGETEEQFNDSLDLIKEITPTVLNISRFKAREGTAAAAMEDQVRGGIVKDRSKKVTDLFHRVAYIQNEKWFGWKGMILIDEKGKNDTWVGRNLAYKPVIVQGDYMIGQSIKVSIKQTAIFDLRGEIV
ncbi:tRNA (N(6)-L-threonylcarbamoyladenosine(37)-C(2))-methylthiotransferase [Nanoarchaeota archaeon]